MTEVGQLFNNTMDSYERQIMRYIDGHETMDRNSLKDAIHNLKPQSKLIFHNVRSTYSRRRMFNYMEQYVEPQSVILGLRSKPVVINGDIELKMTRDYSYYIPIIKNLISWFSCKTLMDMIVNTNKCASNGFLWIFVVVAYLESIVFLKKVNQCPSLCIMMM